MSKPALIIKSVGNVEDHSIIEYSSLRPSILGRYFLEVGSVNVAFQFELGVIGVGDFKKYEQGGKYATSLLMVDIMDGVLPIKGDDAHLSSTCFVLYNANRQVVGTVSLESEAELAEWLDSHKLGNVVKEWEKFIDGEIQPFG